MTYIVQGKNLSVKVKKVENSGSKFFAHAYLNIVRKTAKIFNLISNLSNRFFFFFFDKKPFEFEY